MMSVEELISKITEDNMDELEFAKKKARYDICLYLLKKSYIDLGISTKPVSDSMLMDVAEDISTRLKCPTEKLSVCFSEAVGTKNDNGKLTPITFNDLDHTLKFGFVVAAQDIGDMRRFMPSTTDCKILWKMPSVKNLARIAMAKGAITITETSTGSIKIGYQDTRQPSISYQQDGSSKALLH